ncbi:phosphotransferase [bacterium]|nr:phosphotransferase [bacterium]
MIENQLFSTIDYHKENNLPSEINTEILKEITIPFTGSEILFAQMESGKNVVIKIPGRYGNAKREWIGLNKAHNAGVPVPQPIALALDSRGRQAIISQKIEGDNLYYNPNDAVKYSVGQIIRSMHEHTPISGKEWVNSGKSDFSYFDKRIFYWMNGPTEGLKMGSKTQVLLDKFADSMRDHCQDVFPTFTHNDLHDGQVIISKGKPSLIDFENWKEESPASEIAYYLFHSIRSNRTGEGFLNFMKGYLRNTTLSEQEKSVLMFHLLFISAGAVSYFHNQRINYLEIAESTHQKVLNYVNEENLWKLL